MDEFMIQTLYKNINYWRKNLAAWIIGFTDYDAATLVLPTTTNQVWRITPPPLVLLELELELEFLRAPQIQQKTKITIITTPTEPPATSALRLPPEPLMKRNY